MTSAIDQFESLSASRACELLTTEDAQAAAHFAAGFSRTRAEALALGERAASIWLGPSPPDWTGLSATARRGRRCHVVEELRRVLRLLGAQWEDSDSEGHWQDVDDADE
jgi:hypothetical protein